MCALCQMFTGTPDLGEKIFYAAYLDPGTGFVFSSIIPMFLGFLGAMFAGLVLLMRKKLLPFIKRIWLIIFLLIIISIIIFSIRGKPMNEIPNKKVVVIGLDGLDPKIIDQGFQRNLLPNLRKLKNTGSYSLLQTTNPPQSPVAWASFITGNWPAKHRIYDFIERNPKNYSLDLVFSDPSINPIQSQPFWEITSKYNIPTTVLFLPDTFPISQTKAKMMAGMGVPDVLGTAGTFTLYSSRNYNLDPKWRGRLVKISNAQKIKTSIQGPKYTVLGDKKRISIPFEIEKNSSANQIKISVQNQNLTLEEKRFSGWVKLEFNIDFFTKIRGITKFYVKKIKPDLEIYLSPINFDPNSPVYPISSPKNYSQELTKKYGLFSTLGLPHDTWALEEGIFDDEVFLTQADEILNERKKIILGELSNFKNGLFFGYFGITDTIQHMYWRFLDDDRSKYKDTILKHYQKVDAIVGQVMKALKSNDTLIILSDHGFDRFDYEVNINTWLKENDYLGLSEGKTEGGELLGKIDWNKTRAYAAGYNGIFLNLKNREKNGIVSESERDRLVQEIKDKLLSLINPKTNNPVFKAIYTRKDLNIPQDDIHSPDLYLGYYKYIRSSWDTAVGATPKEIFIKRQTKWSGDHLFDSTEVPGILFVNKTIRAKKPAIVDVIPTVLHELNIPMIRPFDGKNLL
ncbi:alkaline phosphatase family protein [Candidatus Roizmanbacteria bacterium]|nr:alkaline phosphatase family protein [Candidatus Roizmanbacteria bacterium]